ncbi:MAG: PAS domain S-box protein [Euryarchaeota archaeon]|nr:PAS domain S-box protein [Euryarchaeota archaeon]
MQEDKNTAEVLNKINKLKSRIEELEKSESEYERVKESFKRLSYQNKLILESIGEGIYGVDLEGNVTFFNPSAENITGYTAEEIIGKYQHTILHHTKKEGSPYPAEECPVYTTLVDGVSRRISDEIFWRKDGTSFPVEYTSAPIKDRGNIVGAVVIFRDITDRKKAEKDVKDSETRYKSIFENTGTATVIVEEDATIFMVNEEFEKLSRYSKEELEGKKSWTEFVVEDDLDRLEEYHRLRRIDPESAPRNYEFGFIDKYGNVKDVFLTISMIPETKKSLGSLLDVTERKKMEKALRESEEKLRTVLESSPDAITVLDLEGKIMDCNQATVKLHEFSSKEELIGASVFELIAPGERQRAAEALKKSIEQGAMMNVEYMFFTKDGREFPAEASGSLISDETGKPTSLVAITRDITERKKAEQTLKESEERIRGIFESSPDSVQVTDLAGNLIECNNETLNLLGVSSKDEIIGKPVFEYIAPEHRQEVGQAMKMTIKKGLIKRFESVLIDKDGHKFPVEVSANVILDHSGKPTSFIATIKDITERKKAEEALKVSEEKYKGIVEKFLKVSNEIIIEISKK